MLVKGATVRHVLRNLEWRFIGYDIQYAFDLMQQLKV